MDIRWERDWKGLTAFNHQHAVAEIVHVDGGWDARTLSTDLGVYLTLDMATGAAVGMLRVERRGY